jgi:hypothetical protein
VPSRRARSCTGPFSAGMDERAASDVARLILDDETPDKAAR